MRRDFSDFLFRSVSVLDALKNQGAGICTFPGLPCNFLLLVILQSSCIFWILRRRGKQTNHRKHTAIITFTVSNSAKRIDSGGPDLGTLRARPSALDARALGVPSWGPLQQIQAPGGRFQPWGPREGTPRIRAPTADRGGLGVGPLAPLRPALCRQLHPWGSPGRDPPSPTVQSGLGGSGGGSPPSPTVQSATSLSPTQKRLTQNCRPGTDPSALRIWAVNRQYSNQSSRF